MLLFNRQNGIVKLEMNEKDAVDLAGVLEHSKADNFSFNLSQMTMVDELPKLLLEKDSPNSEEDALAIPHYWFHQERGDLFLCNWARNDPTEPGWVPISQSAYELLCGNLTR